MDVLSIKGAEVVDHWHDGGYMVTVRVTDRSGADHELAADIWPYHTARVYFETATEHSPEVDYIDLSVRVEDILWEDYGDVLGDPGDPVTVRLDAAGARMVEELIIDGSVGAVLRDMAREAAREVGR